MYQRYHTSYPVNTINQSKKAGWVMAGVIMVMSIIVALGTAIADTAMDAARADTGLIDYLRTIDDETKSDDMVVLLKEHACVKDFARTDVCISDNSSTDADTTAPPSTPADQDKVLATAKAIQRVAKQLSDREAVTFANLVHLNGEKYSINPKLLLGIISVESRFNPRAHSKHGAKGLMQVMHRIHKDKIRGRDPYRADVSVEVGSRIFKDCMTSKRGNVRKALTCYNGGGRKYASLVLSAVNRLRGYM